MDKLKQIRKPAWIVGGAALVSLGLSVWGIVKTDKKMSEMPSAFLTLGLVVLGALIMMYAVHCLHKGDCNVFSWVVAVFVGLVIILPTGILAKTGFAGLQDKLTLWTGKVQSVVPGAK
jgi:hypothetical protein